MSAHPNLHLEGHGVLPLTGRATESGHPLSQLKLECNGDWLHVHFDRQTTGGCDLGVKSDSGFLRIEIEVDPSDKRASRPHNPHQ
jgi:hypothetical protein